MTHALILTEDDGSPELTEGEQDREYAIYRETNDGYVLCPGRTYKSYREADKERRRMSLGSKETLIVVRER